MSKAASSPGFRHWWALALVSAGLLAVGVDRMAERRWRPPPTDSDLLMSRVHHRLQTRHPALFAPWALFGDRPPSYDPDASAGPRAQIGQGRQLILDAAPSSVAAALLVQWTWHCRAYRDAFELGNHLRGGTQLDRTLGQIERLTGWRRTR